MNNKKSKSFNCSSSKIISIQEKKEPSIKNKSYHPNRKQKSQRINSLEKLTRKFIEYIWECVEDSIINLYTVAKVIRIKKSRLNKITNVFEGK